MKILDEDQVARRLVQATAHRASVSPEKLIDGFVHMFNLLDTGVPDEFVYPARTSTRRERIFGGQVIAQAMVAADQTVGDAKTLHSLHSYFLRAGDETKPLHFRVHRDFDGRSISNRRVVVRQDDKVIFNLTASFQKASDGLHHQLPMPDLLPPEQCDDRMEALVRNASISDDHIERMSAPWPFETRVSPKDNSPHPVRHYQWFRTVAGLPDDPLVHQAALGFASDMGLLSTSLLAHDLHWTTPGLFSTSLDHAMWFHDEFRADEWTCYVMDSDWTGGTRGLNRGAFYSRDGKMTASAVQEGLIRIQPPKG